MPEVTIYKQVKNALNLGKEHLYAFMDALPQMAWIANPNGKVTYFNKAWYTYTHMKPEQTEGWINVVHPEDSSQAIAAWNNALINGTYHIEYRIRNHNNREFNWFLEQAMPIRDEEGKIIIWFGIYTDVNNEKLHSEEP